jgi:signal transduction histidine kinase
LNGESETRMKHLSFFFLLFTSLQVFSQEDYANRKLTVAECLQLVDKNKALNDLKEATRFLNAAAMKVWEDKNYTDAIQYFNQSIELNKQINNVSGVSKIHSNLGMIYSDLKDYQKSLDYFQLSLDYRLNFGEKTEIISTYINKAVVLNKLSRYDEAVKNLESALQLATEMSDALQMKSCYGMLAETYEKAGNQERTIHYFNLYRTFHEMVQRNRVNEANKETETVKLHMLQAELEKKEKELQLMATSKELEETEIQLEGMTNEMRALLNKNTKKELAVTLLERKLEIEKLKIADAEAQNSTQKIWIVAIVVGLILLFMSVALLYRNYQYKKKMNLQLSEQNEEIKTFNEGLESQVQKRTGELQKTLATLEKRNRDLDQFSHVISHNLRGPVANILGLGEVVNRSNPGDPVNIEVFDRLLNATQNLDTVVKDLSVILKVKDNQSIPKEKIIVNDVIESVKKLLRAEIEKSNLAIQIEDDQVKQIDSVKPYFESIVYNLFSNAIKYSVPNSKPTVWVRTQLKDDEFIFSVRDNGTGINQTNLEKIFEPYKRLTLNGEGKGLGLYLVRTQVEAMKGRIEVISKEGEGSTFSIYLPQPDKRI